MHASDNRIIYLAHTYCMQGVSQRVRHYQSTHFYFFTIDIVHTFETRLENRYRIREATVSSNTYQTIFVGL